jgi:hypothetical protein
MAASLGRLFLRLTYGEGIAAEIRTLSQNDLLLNDCAAVKRKAAPKRVKHPPCAERYERILRVFILQVGDPAERIYQNGSDPPTRCGCGHHRRSCQWRE